DVRLGDGVGDLIVDRGRKGHGCLPYFTARPDTALAPSNDSTQRVSAACATCCAFCWFVAAFCAASPAASASVWYTVLSAMAGASANTLTLLWLTASVIWLLTAVGNAILEPPMVDDWLTKCPRHVTP